MGDTSGDPGAAYSATQRAIDATGEWPALNLTGKTVVIKPNLVRGIGPESGAVTDPEVVRAIVDRCLAGGAIVKIVEASPVGAMFDATGYTATFGSYDPRVTLIDLQSEPVTLAPVVRTGSGYGWAYAKIWAPSLLLEPDCVLISAAKLKTHAEATLTAGVKNLFGLPAVDRYASAHPSSLSVASACTIAA